VVIARRFSRFISTDRVVVKHLNPVHLYFILIVCMTQVDDAEVTMTPSKQEVQVEEKDPTLKSELVKMSLNRKS
jgi:hypothetical protein